MFKNSSIFYAGAFTVLLWVAQGPAAKIDAPHVSIALPDDVASETVQIRYFLTGPFGGYGGYLKQETGRHSYQIPASVDGKAANEMRLIVFARGCAIQTFILNLNEGTKPAPEFQCHRIPTVRLSGRIFPEELIRYGNAEVVVTYFAPWAHSFFGIVDGLVLQVQLGESPVSAEGQFDIDIPNFTSSDTLPLYRENGFFGLYVCDTKTWNPIGSRLEIEPSDLLSAGQGLKILSFYPNLIVNISSSSVSSEFLGKSPQLPGGAR